MSGAAPILRRISEQVGDRERQRWGRRRRRGDSLYANGILSGRRGGDGDGQSHPEL